MDLERRDRMSVIHNFCDDALFAPVPAAAASPTILFFGTLSRAKGVLQLAEAANRFLAELPDAELQFIGKDAGEEGGRVSERILRTVDPSLRGRVKVLGPMPNSELPARIVSARLCVFPSQEEAFGLTVIEAMACGRPLVASTRGAHRDIVTDGTDGLLADPHDPAALAGAVIRLYRDEGLRRKMGEAARATVQEQFSAARGVEANLSFYRSVIT
jgi:glycosyltransferase involved in cell wall biosynthesis